MRTSSQDPPRGMQALPSLRLQQFSEGVSWLQRSAGPCSFSSSPALSASLQR